MIELLYGAIALLAIALLVALVVLFATMRRTSRVDIEEEFVALTDRVNDMGEAQTRAQERLERGLRGDIAESTRVSRMESQSGFTQFHQTLATQLASTSSVQNAQFDALAQQLAQQSQQARDDQGNALKRFADSMTLHLGQLSEANERRLGEVRATLESAPQRTSRRTTRRSSMKCAAPSMKSCIPRWSSGSANRSSWCRTGSNKCIGA